jgi:beta-N-acetylhexosaminidase
MAAPEWDSHKELPTVTASDAELETDIAPFRSLHDAQIGMTGHVRYTAWDEENPATLSATVIRDVIRGRIGFDGLLLTDDLDMQALGGAVPDRAARAQAGRLRHCAQLLGEDGRHGRDRQGFGAHVC